MPRGSSASNKRKQGSEVNGSNDQKRTKGSPVKKSSGGDTASGETLNQAGNAQSSDSRTLKIISWNINGIRAWFKNEKDAIAFLRETNADVYCFQETKCDLAQIPPALKAFEKQYHLYWNDAGKQGQHGVGLMSRIKPLSVTHGLQIDKHDEESRSITAEYEQFYLVNVYVPNSGRGLPRLKYRTEEWDKDFRDYLIKLDKEKPVIVAGDLNVAHKPIDLANPKTNLKTAGFTPEERESFTETLKQTNFVDTFRHFHPDEPNMYTFWSYMRNSRAKNIGWRLDYFLVSNRMMDKVAHSRILESVLGSDHCPIELGLNI